MTRPGIEHRSPGLLVNTLTIMPISGIFLSFIDIHISLIILIYIYTYIVICRQTVSLYHNSSVWLDTQDA